MFVPPFDTAFYLDNLPAPRPPGRRQVDASGGSGFFVLPTPIFPPFLLFGWRMGLFFFPPAEVGTGEVPLSPLPVSPRV